MSRAVLHGFSPVLAAMRVSLHLLFAGLLGLVVVMAATTPSAPLPAIVIAAAVMAATWAAGPVVAAASDRTMGRAPRLIWIAVLLLEWAALIWLSAHAAYLLFPLCFVITGALSGPLGAIVVAMATGGVVVALGLHDGWSLGAVIGPIIGAAVAVVIALGSAALAAEAREHERLFRELELAQSRIAATERSAGAAAERERLARDIHDTVAQNLSSIMLLLHAAERADPDGAGVEHVQRARVSTAEALADVRGLVRDLTPAPLAGGSLAAALRELGASMGRAAGIDVSVHAAETVDLPMDHQVALLRIAQGALGNVASHADARTATLEVTVDATSARMTIVDDGRGFDPSTAPSGSAHGSFGLRSIRERVEQLDGSVAVSSSPGRGTTVAVELPLRSAVQP